MTAKKKTGQKLRSFMSGWRAVYSYDPGRRRGLLFEVDEEKLLGQLREHMSRQFLYLNVAANESLFLFQERYADYETVAKELYQFLRISTMRSAIWQ